jgi:hypothetical protein
MLNSVLHLYFKAIKLNNTRVSGTRIVTKNECYYVSSKAFLRRYITVRISGRSSNSPLKKKLKLRVQ